MRLVLQRVTRAGVTIDGSVVGAIDRGLMVLVGIGQDDTPAVARALADRTCDLRIFRDAAGLTNLSLMDVSGEVLAISQFTLYADTRKGRRPSWNNAAPGPVAEPLVEAVVAALRGRGVEVATGVFGADMQVSLVNDGPVTLVVDV